MPDKKNPDPFEELFSGLEEPEETPTPDVIETTVVPPATKTNGGPAHKPLSQPYIPPGPVPAGSPEHSAPQAQVNWRFLIWAVLGTLAVLLLAAYGQALFLIRPDESEAGQQARFVVPPTSTASATPTPIATGAPGVDDGHTFSFAALTPTPSPLPGGRVLLLTPAARDGGWVVSRDDSIESEFDPQNHFGSSFLYAGLLDEKIYHAAFQFDLRHVPRGVKIHAAGLRLTGLRDDQLGQGGEWQVHLLDPAIDPRWREHNYHQIYTSAALSALQPALTAAQLGSGRLNQFEFSPEQLALLERRILEGSDNFGRQISFRIDGPMSGANNLFAWDSGYGPGSQGAGPELFLSLGPPPEETPPPYYVVITSTPTPENLETAVALSLQATAEAGQNGTATPLPRHWVTPVVVTITPTPENEGAARVQSQQATAIALTTGEPPNLATATTTPTYVIITSTPTPLAVETAAAHSLQATAEAGQFGTATPLPRNWVTPVVVTVTPTAQNPATAQAMAGLATAIALTTGEPPNLATATATPTYVIITSTPTPANIMTAGAQAFQVTAAALRNGTATPFPDNWVTPAVVVNTPTPANSATVEYWQAVAFTTGTPTATPGNVQTATPTPVLINGLPSPTATASPSPTPQSVPAQLLGKIIFLSDREGATEAERIRADRLQATPQVTPQPYVFDPETGEVSRLTGIWPYRVAATREAWSADGQFETYNQELLWMSDPRLPNIAIHYYDHFYNVEHQVTRMGAGIVYDPAWSPVSDEIAFVATETGNDDIWIIRRDGTQVRQLTRNAWAWDKHPTWSPAGQQVVFYSNRTGTNQLWLINKDGSGERLLMEPNSYNDFDPVWIKTLEPAPALERLPDWRFIKPEEEQNK